MTLVLLLLPVIAGVAIVIAVIIFLTIVIVIVIIAVMLATSYMYGIYWIYIYIHIYILNILSWLPLLCFQFLLFLLISFPSSGAQSTQTTWGLICNSGGNWPTSVWHSTGHASRASVCRQSLLCVSEHGNLMGFWPRRMGIKKGCMGV